MSESPSPDDLSQPGQEPPPQWPGQQWPGQQWPGQEPPQQPWPGQQWPGQPWPGQQSPQQQWPGQQWPGQQPYPAQYLPQQMQPGALAMPKNPGSNSALISLILGICSVVLFFLGLLTAAAVVIAIVFSVKSRSTAQAAGWPVLGMATAGLVLGIVGGAFYILFGLFTLGVGFIV